MSWPEWRDDIPWKAKAGHEKHEDFELFQARDAIAWIVFTIMFFALVLFDNFVLNRTYRRMTLRWACLYTFFWVSVAFVFAIFIWFHRGMNDMFIWTSGYILEWTLSVDNLFVFHIIFSSFCTPEHLKHKPLFWGIVGAIFFRLVFFLAEGLLLHYFAWMYVIIGLFLIYTGIKSAMFDEDEEEDPRKNKLFRWLQTHIRFINAYDDDGAFFVRVRVDKKTGQVVLPVQVASRQTSAGRSVDSRPTDLEEDATKPSLSKSPSAASMGEALPLVLRKEDFYETPRQTFREASADDSEYTYKWHATLLFMVVICLELADIVFALDSVSAIVAQIPDLFLAYTACVMAMLGLRALFFMVDELVHLFSMLKYGVALILIFIGLKLIIKDWVHIPTFVMLGMLVGTLVVSIIASLLYNYFVEGNTQAHSGRAD